MAIFEQETPRKVLLDDTETVSCVIENWRNVNGHIEYVIRVQRGPLADKSWHVQKRYNDFVTLHGKLVISGLPLALPPKRLIGNMDPDFVSERQQKLQQYLNYVMMNPILASSLPAKSFVDPANYCQPFSEIALQHVSLALRGQVGWEVISPLTDIGWRLRKHYYQVRCKAVPKDELLASWIDYGPDKYLEEKDLHAVFKSLMQLRHPYIHPIKLCLCTDVGALVVRTNHDDGTVRDLLCQTKPRQPFVKKYGNPRGHKPLTMNQVALYGKQVLEALSFLHDKGFPYGHLHVGNIIVKEDRVKLLDIENSVLGVPSFYRPYFMQHRRICTAEAVDVYCFGQTVYEMAFGFPLQESNLENVPSDCCPNLKSLLDSILSAEAFKNGMPTLDSLLKHNFFASIVASPPRRRRPDDGDGDDDKIYFKIPTATKVQIKHAQAQVEDRLKEEQKMVRSQKRLTRVQELMSSEEEKKKQKKKKKQERKLQVMKTSLDDEQKEKMNGTVTSGERADRANSESTATSIGTATPPSASGSSNIPSPVCPLLEPPAAPPLPPPPSLPPHSNGTQLKRAALLGAIATFDKSNLRKTKSTG